MIEFGELGGMFTLCAGSLRGAGGAAGLLTCVAASLLMRFSDWPLTLAGLTVADFKSACLSLFRQVAKGRAGLWRQAGLGLGSGSVTTNQPRDLGQRTGLLQASGSPRLKSA